MVTLRDAQKKFKNVPILKHLNLHIDAGQIVGLAGASGSGKSTLLRCIQGLETLDHGEIVRPVHIGFMFQDFQLFPHMTVIDNLIYAPLHQKKDRTVCLKEAEHLLASLELLQHRNTYPGQLSGGQKQRAALARALMMHPDLLLCDEPTSGLDRGSIGNVIQILKRIHARGVTLFIASHDVDFLCDLCHRIIMMRQGTIVFDVSVEEIKADKTTLYQFYEKE